MNHLPTLKKQNKIALLEFSLLKFALFGSFVLSLSVQSANANEDVYQLGNVTIDNRSESELVIYNLLEDEGNEAVTTAGNQSAEDSYQLPTPVKKMLSAELPYRDEVHHAARQTKLDAALIDAVIAVESGYNANAVSKKGAFGLMQMMPETAKSLASKVSKPNSAKQQVMLGALYLRKMLDLFEGNLALALAAYNAGPQAIKKHHGNIPPYLETQRYVPKVLAYYQFLKSQKQASLNRLVQK